MYTIAKQFSFSASHQLDHLPAGHPCARLHGHNYVVEIRLAAPALDSDDFVVEYGDLEPFKKLIDGCLDHRHLNEVVPYRTTSENIARWLFEQARAFWPQVISVRVSETPYTWAQYQPHDACGDES